MFVEKLRRESPQLIDAICRLHQAGRILPDSYVIDLDQFRRNAAAIKAKADENQIRLWFMLKQLGRNPRLARELVELGYPGAVVVDFKEAQVMMNNHIPLGNVGHLVQPPQAMLRQIIDYGAQVITVYSLEKARAISDAALSLGKKQSILIRVFDSRDHIYSGQTAGVDLSRLPDFLREVSALPGVEVHGVTSFPCYLYQEEVGDIAPTPNLETVTQAARILREQGVEPRILNTPSATSCRTLELMSKLGGNCGEPGHGLTGTTPAHAEMELPEKQCIAYLSEVSHNFAGKAYCYGGGFYRRGHMAHALVGSQPEQLRPIEVTPPSLESIDYHFELAETAQVGESVVMAFRYQIFVTRSDVVLLSGVAQGDPQVVGVWDSLGNQKA